MNMQRSQTRVIRFDEQTVPGTSPDDLNSAARGMSWGGRFEDLIVCRANVLNRPIL